MMFVDNNCAEAWPVINNLDYWLHNTHHIRTFKFFILSKIEPIESTYGIISSNLKVLHNPIHQTLLKTIWECGQILFIPIWSATRETWTHNTTYTTKKPYGNAIMVILISNAFGSTQIVGPSLTPLDCVKILSSTKWLRVTFSSVLFSTKRKSCRFNCGVYYSDVSWCTHLLHTRFVRGKNKIWYLTHTLHTLYAHDNTIMNNKRKNIFCFVSTNEIIYFTFISQSFFFICFWTNQKICSVHKMK
jgi:hypothetical protein